MGMLTSRCRRVARSSKQQRQQLGRPLRRVPGKRMDTSLNAELAPCLHHHAAGHAVAGEGGRGYRSGTRHQHWQRGRVEGAGAGDVCVLEQQGGSASLEQGAGESFGEEEYHVSHAVPFSFRAGLLRRCVHDADVQDTDRTRSRAVRSSRR